MSADLLGKRLREEVKEESLHEVSNQLYKCTKIPR